MGRGGGGNGKDMLSGNNCGEKFDENFSKFFSFFYKNGGGGGGRERGKGWLGGRGEGGEDGMNQ